MRDPQRRLLESVVCLGEVECTALSFAVARDIFWTLQVIYRGTRRTNDVVLIHYKNPPPRHVTMANLRPTPIAHSRSGPMTRR